jgi:hypothetical protein
VRLSGGSVGDFFSIRNGEGVVADLEGALHPAPPSHATVPDVLGLKVQEASLRICRLGLTVDTVVVTTNPSPVEGTVVRQEPQAGKKLRCGRTVTLYLEFRNGLAAT